MPKDVIALLNSEVREVVNTLDVRERFAAQVVAASVSTQEERGAILAAEIALWGKVIKTAGIRID